MKRKTRVERLLAHCNKINYNSVALLCVLGWMSDQEVKEFYPGFLKKEALPQEPEHLENPDE